MLRLLSLHSGFICVHIVSFTVLRESDRATLPVIATVFDKLNQEYKKYLDAEQSYTMVSQMDYGKGSCHL
jgi:hypothetical protein